MSRYVYVPPPEQSHYQSKSGFEDIVAKAKELVLTEEYYVPKVVFETDHRISLHHVDPSPANWRAYMKKLGASVAQLEIGGKLGQVFLICDGWVDRECLLQGEENRLSTDTWPKEVLIITGIQVDEKTETGTRRIKQKLQLDDFCTCLGVFV